MSSLSAYPFLKHEFTLWNKSMGDPLLSNDADSISLKKKKFDGRFVQGQYTFPFSFPFPTNANSTTKSIIDGDSISPFPSPAHNHMPNISEKRRRTSCFTSNMSPLSDTASSSSQISSPITSILSPVRHSLTSPLPQSFVEKTIGPTVTYEILVRIVHGRLRTSSR